MERIEKDEGLPIYYFTNGVVTVIGNTVMVDDRIVFRIIDDVEHKPRGYRTEIAIYDDTISDKDRAELIEPMMKGRTLLIKDTVTDKEN